MTPEERDLPKRWFEEVWNRGRREAIAEMIAAGVALHDAGNDSVGIDGFYLFFDRLRAALSDIHVTVHDTIAEGDRVCVRWSCAAKHTGPELGVDPMSKDIHVTGIGVMRIANGKMVEAWQNWDMLGMMEQIRDHPKAPLYVAAAPAAP